MVNNLEIKKIHVALMGMAALLLAALAAVALAGLPTFDLVYNFGFGWARAEWIVNQAMRVSTVYAFLIAVGSGIAGLLYFTTFYTLKRIIRYYGVRAAIRY